MNDDEIREFEAAAKHLFDSVGKCVENAKRLDAIEKLCLANNHPGVNTVAHKLAGRIITIIGVQ